jgi:tetratricopeptide (TPR) repeat protein
MRSRLARPASLAISVAVAVAVVVVGSSVATLAAPSDDAFARYRKALRAGRKAENKGDLAGAAAAFNEALAARPNDGAAQTELGWIAFQQKDLDKAEQLSRKAISALDNAQLLGGAWYNLGRALEAKGNRAGAIEAYKSSLGKRPNRVVRERLATLDPAAAAAADPATPKLLKGPFSSFADMCSNLGDGNCLELETLAKPPAPWKTVQVVTHGEEEEMALAVQTKAGWFASDDLADCSYDRSQQRCKVEELSAAQLLDGPTPELRLQFVESLEYRMDFESGGETLHPLVSDDTHSLVVCGANAAGKPSCSSQLIVGVSAQGGAMLSAMDFKLDAAFAGDQLEIKSKSGKVPSDYRDVLGLHKVLFP